MLSISGGWNSSNIGSLFSSLPGSGTSSSSSLSGLTSVLSEYNSIRSGNYKKLLTEYYKQGLDKTTAEESSKTTTKKSTDSETSLKEIKSEAEDLSKSGSALMEKGSKSVFTKDSNSKYDTAKIYEAVDKFVSDYNDLISAASDSKTSSISNSYKSMISNTDSNETKLNRIGITVGKDNKLSIDKDKFEKADMNSVKSLFNVSGGYGYQVAAKASMIASSADSKLSSSSGYSSTGAKTSSDIMNSFNYYA